MQNSGREPFRGRSRGERGSGGGYRGGGTGGDGRRGQGGGYHGGRAYSGDGRGEGAYRRGGEEGRILRNPVTERNWRSHNNSNNHHYEVRRVTVENERLQVELERAREQLIQQEGDLKGLRSVMKSLSDQLIQMSLEGAPKSEGKESKGGGEKSEDLNKLMKEKEACFDKKTDQLQNEIDDLRKKLTEAVEEVGQHKGALQAKDSEIRGIQQALDEHVEKFSQMEKEHTLKLQELEELRGDLETVGKIEQDAQKQLQEMTTLMNEQEETLEGLRAANEEEVEGLKQRLAQAEKELEEERKKKASQLSQVVPSKDVAILGSPARQATSLSLTPSGRSVFALLPPGTGRTLTGGSGMPIIKSTYSLPQISQQAPSTSSSSTSTALSTVTPGGSRPVFRRIIPLSNQNQLLRGNQRLLLRPLNNRYLTETERQGFFVTSVQSSVDKLKSAMRPLSTPAIKPAIKGSSGESSSSSDEGMAPKPQPALKTKPSTSAISSSDSSDSDSDSEGERNNKQVPATKMPPPQPLESRLMELLAEAGKVTPTPAANQLPAPEASQKRSHDSSDDDDDLAPAPKLAKASPSEPLVESESGKRPCDVMVSDIMRCDESIPPSDTDSNDDKDHASLRKVNDTASAIPESTKQLEKSTSGKMEVKSESAVVSWDSEPDEKKMKRNDGPPVVQGSTVHWYAKDNAANQFVNEANFVLPRLPGKSQLRTTTEVGKYLDHKDNPAPTSESRSNTAPPGPRAEIEHIRLLLHRCNVCSDAFQSLAQLNIHKKIVHSSTISPSTRGTTAMTKSRTPPSNVFVTDSNGQAHGFGGELVLPTENDTREGSAPGIPSSSSSGVIHFLCICGKQYTKRESLQAHFWLVKRHQMKIFRCSLCPPDRKPFATHAELKTHVNNFHKMEYYGERYACVICARTFPSMTELTNHRKADHLN